MEWVCAWKGDGMNRDLFAAAGGVVDATTDPYFNSTTLLLSGDGTNGAQNNTFIDSSVNNATITRAGSPTQGSFSPFSQTGWSGYFDGTSNYLTAPASAIYDFGSGAFTVEYWIYSTTVAEQYVAYHGWAGAGGFNYGWRAGTNASNQLFFYANGGIITCTDSVISTNVWTHVAFVGSGGIIAAYKNGVKSATTYTYTSLVDRPSSILGIGGFNNADENIPGRFFFGGYISNFRIVKGTAVYTTNFTPPTAPLTATQAGNGSTIQPITGTATSLLTLQDNRFKDNAVTPNTITVSGTPSVQAFSPFAPTAAYSLPAAAAGSAYFNGSSNLLVPAGAPFNLTTVDFCIEMWVYPIAQSTYGALLSFDVQDYPLMVQWAAAGSANIRFYAGSSTAWISGTPLDFGTTVLNTWAHICVTRTSGVFRTFKNGVLSTVLAGQESYSIGDSVGSVYVGSNGAAGGFSTAYISNLRIIKGTGNVPAAYQTSSTTLGTTIFTPPSAPLTAVTGTSLLTLQDSTFKDNSVNVATITASSPAPVIQSFTPFTQVWGGSFNGTTDYLTIPANTAFVFGTGDFTMEAWVYATALPTAPQGTIMANGGNSNVTTNYAVHLYLSTTLYPSLYVGTSTTQSVGITSSSAILVNTWNHIAATRSGNTFTVWVNGVSSATGTSSVNLNTSQDLYISREYSDLANRYLTGYISNARIVKGTAVYTGAFTPPAKTLSATQAAGTNISAIYPGQTSLLTLQDPTFKDNAILPNTITTAGTPKAQLVSAPFTSAATVDPVSGSGYFDGSSYISVPDSTAFTMGSGDFTLEAWVYLTTSGVSRVIIGTCDAAGSQGSMSFVLGVNASNNAIFAIGYAGALYTSTNTATVPTNQWVHIAGVRNGGGIYAYLNGVQSTSNTSMGALAITDSTQVVAIGRNGAYNGEYVTGYISNARIVKGTAVYTAAFQPPSAPLTAITNTSLLTLQDTTFKDNSTNALAITAAGSPAMRAFTPFASNWGGYFDGSSYLSVPKNTALEPATSGAWTIEFFCYTGSGSSQRPWTYGNATISSGPDLGTYFSLSGGGTVKGGFYSGVNATTVTGGTVLLNQWNHVALVSNGTMMTLYLNGISVGTPVNISGVAINAPSSATGRIGIYESTATDYFNGYISNFRFVKGVAVYTTNFQPPSAPLTKTQTASGNIAAISTAVPTVDVLVVAGGGGGGSLGGGGGAGGYRTSTGYSISPGSPITITVGSGGAGSTYTTNGTNGLNSVFGSITSTGGGGGGSWGAGPGVAGGSGGGAAGVTGSYSGGAASPAGQGNKGGDATGTGTAGGGGAGAAGGDAVNIGSNGGVGLSTNISGTLTYYAGGGGAGQYNNQHGAGTGGTGGGGNGDNTNTGGSPGTANTGGGGGGGSYSGSGFLPGAAGGSGIVIVRHADTYPTATTTGTVIVTTSGGYKSYSFTTSGTITFTEPTSLLTLQNNTFIDNSSNTATITPSGAPKTQLLQLPFTSSITKVAAPWNISVTAPLATVGGSMYFDGSSYLSCGTGYQTFTGDFTIELWANFANVNSGYDYYLLDSANIANNFTIEALNNQFRYNYSGTNRILASYTIAAGVWYHIALVRSISTVTMYVNGSSIGTYNQSGSINNSPGPWIIGAPGGLQAWRMNGYISNLRIVNGTAVYTGNFTPPAAPPQPTQTPGLLGTNVNAIDGTSSSLLLLGSNAGIYDATAKNDIITVGDTKVSSTQIKYGTGAMYFDGTGDYLTMPASQNVTFGTGDFTIESWVYLTSTPSSQMVIVSTYQSISSGFSFTIESNVIKMRMLGDPVVVSGATSVTINTWHHVAISRNGTSLKVFLDGVQDGSTTNSDNIALNSTLLNIGRLPNNSGFLVGYIDDLRITKAARYTTNFTPPTKAMIGQ